MSNIHTNTFSPEELSRYSRHFSLPQFGTAGQEQLKGAKVLVVGCGGLGSPLLQYLAAAGVGTIGLMDFDVVEWSNLQRQVLFDVNDIGKPKAIAAQQKIKALNPYVETKVYTEKLTAANAMDIIKEYEVVADGTDNFATRYLINDACVLLGKPYVYAAILQFEGQVAVFNYTKNGETGPNYRDLFPVPPSPEAVPNCGEAGVLGVLPGIIGSMQALEVIKVITGIGEPLSGRLFIFDTLSFQTNVFNIKRSAANPLNGTHPTITQLIDYEQFCGISTSKNSKAVTPQQLHDWQQNEAVQLIDVREPYEYEIVNIGGELIPLNIIIDNVNKIDRHKKVVLHCKSGSRSLQAIQLLEEDFGFTNLYNLKGGILQYIDEVAPHLPKY